MNWITNLLFSQTSSNGWERRSIPDNLWETCPKCSQMLLKKELISEQFVCKHCDYHFRITSKERLELFLVKVI